jgi:hypothetical protein
VTALFRRSSSSQQRARWPLAIRLVLSAIASCTVALLAWFLYWHIRREALIDRIRAAGDPLLPSDIVLPPARPGRDPSAWLEEIVKLEGSNDHWDVTDPDDDAMMLARARANEFAPDVNDAIEQLHECRQTSADWSPDNEREARKSLFAALVDAVPPSQLSSCQRAALLACSVTQRPRMSLGEEACQLGRRDSLRGLKEIKTFEEALGMETYTGALIRTVCALREAAPADASRGDAASAIHRLVVALCVTRIVDAPSGHPGEGLRSLLQQLVLGGLRATLPMLPRGMDLSIVEDEIGAIDFRAQRISALKAERARNRWIYDWFHHASNSAFREGMQTKSPWEGPVLWLYFHRDEVICLDLYEQGLQCLRTPYWKLDRTWLDRYRQDLSRSLDAHFDGALVVARRLEALRVILLARAMNADVESSSARRQAPVDAALLRECLMWGSTRL